MQYKNSIIIVEEKNDKVWIEIPISSDFDAAFPDYVNSNIKQTNSSHKVKLKLELVPKAFTVKW